MKKLLVLLAIAISTNVFANEAETMSKAPKVCRVPQVDKAINEFESYLEDVSIHGEALDKAMKGGNTKKGCAIASELLENLDYLQEKFNATQKALTSEQTFKEFEKKCGMTKSRMFNLYSLITELMDNNAGIIQEIENMSATCWKK